MKSFTCKLVIVLFLLTFFGCTTFTQEDYDLQQKKYDRDRKIQEQKDKESVNLRW